MGALAFDTETRGLDWFDADQRAFMASWADASGEYCADLGDPTQAAQFIEALKSADRLICHNLSFDAHQVRATLGIDVLSLGVPLEDTDLISRVMHPEGQRAGERGGHGLKNLATVYLRADAQEAEAHMFELADAAKIKMKQKGGYYDLWRAYPEAMEKYARLDARFTYDLYEHFMSGIDAEQLGVYELERRVAPVLIQAEATGVAVDQEPVQKLLREFKGEQARLHDYLSTELGDEALGGQGSEEALIEALQMIGVPLTEKTNTGKLATNRFALQKFEAEFPQITALFDLRRVNKFLATYIEPMVDREVVHPSFRQIGAWTGRMSCTRPNMQNIPKAAGKEVRSMFVPRPGYCFIVVDYEQIEFRLLAYYLNDPGLKQLMNDGHDPFAWLAAEVRGGEYEYYLKGAPGEGDRKDCKNVTYAICYGAGKPRVTNMLDLDPGPWKPTESGELVPTYAAAAKIIGQVKGTLPNYYKLNSRIKSKIQKLGYVNTLWGRKQVVSKDKAYVGLDALIQGGAGDIFKQGVYLVNEAVGPLGGTPLLFVHDEIVVEVPLENRDEALGVTNQALCDAYPLDPRLAVEGGIVTTNYADA